MIKIMLIGVVFICSGCAGMPGMPGYISESYSKFDNATELHMKPAYGINGSGYKALALFWSTRMDKNTVIMEVHITPAAVFSREESLKFRIRDKTFSFKSIDSTENIYSKEGAYSPGINIPSSLWASRRYEVPVSFIEKIIAAENPVIRIELLQAYLEGEFIDEPLSAQRSFKDFLEKMAELTGKSSQIFAAETTNNNPRKRENSQ